MMNAMAAMLKHMGTVFSPGMFFVPAAVRFFMVTALFGLMMLLMVNLMLLRLLLLLWCLLRPGCAKT
ncbi:hypothetical protein [Mucilaginibacter gotjawali]|uniref:Uncharacterized protein n=1 Tax=Mucilaginibacter gotjawali TaxID=1550579 RepID=A0A839SKV1_9SPHI|nr:hypothetical protein [Mucilaginibacter gotjawali]MBB3057159.1 hypothetical protein [Mucilaginibacter gotjawali]